MDNTGNYFFCSFSWRAALINGSERNFHLMVLLHDTAMRYDCEETYVTMTNIYIFKDIKSTSFKLCYVLRSHFSCGFVAIVIDKHLSCYNSSSELRGNKQSYTMRQRPSILWVGVLIALLFVSSHAAVVVSCLLDSILKFF